jgi:hypothetical protein
MAQMEVLEQELVSIQLLEHLANQMEHFMLAAAVKLVELEVAVLKVRVALKILAAAVVGPVMILLEPVDLVLF